MNTDNFSTPLLIRQVAITDQFWHEEQETVRKEVIPFQWDALNDRVPDAAPSYCMHNFRAAGKRVREKQLMGKAYQEPSYTYRGFETLPEDTQNPDPDQFYGLVFQDTDFSKWIEAVAYSLAQHPDTALEEIADGAVEIVCAAQHETGYLDTYYIVNGMDRAFTNLKDHHELYCMGHLIEGAVAYYQSTGKDKLLKAACRFADYVTERFGNETGQCKGYPGHEIAEMALVRLYEVTGNEKYLNLSKFFLDQRGTKPYYFDSESKRSAELDGKSYKDDTNPLRYAYYQAHKPVREQDEAVGHAVRAGYLYSGMADVARLTEDEEMFLACKKLWSNIVEQKLYITGGVGGTCYGEAYSYPYDLPNDSAYSETCASISLVYFARRMLQIEPKSEYADVMELALYNTVLAGMALDGKSFFYVNPLEVLPEATRRDSRIFHVKPVRQKWFGCACCPPNIARTVSSVGSYAYTENQNTLWVHLYAGGTVEKKVEDKTLRFKMVSGMPWNGHVELTVLSEEEVNCTVAFRLPGWCVDSAVINAPEGMERAEKDGYCYLQGVWRKGDVVGLEFPMHTIMTAAHPFVREDVGKVAFTRGPIVYCAEEKDNGRNMHLYKADRESIGENCGNIAVVGGSIDGHEMMMLEIPVLHEMADTKQRRLYTEYRECEYRKEKLKMIPYYAWANRGEGEMRIWIRI